MKTGEPSHHTAEQHRGTAAPGQRFQGERPAAQVGEQHRLPRRVQQPVAQGDEEHQNQERPHAQGGLPTQSGQGQPRPQAGDQQKGRMELEHGDEEHQDEEQEIHRRVQLRKSTHPSPSFPPLRARVCVLTLS